MLEFEHLHTHSHFSLLDGLSSIRSICERALEYGQKSVCVTDHGSIAGIPELFRTAKEYGLKPIAGIEAYFCKDHTIKDKTSETYHLTLIAKNFIGYKNLCHLVTKSYRQGFYGKPRIDIELLREHHAGLIILGGCMNGIIAQAIINNDQMAASSYAFEMNESVVMNGDFYLEYMDHGIKEQKAINATYDRLRKKNGIKGVVTQDSHYMFEEDAKAHQTLLCIGTRSTIIKPSFKFNGGPYHYCNIEHVAKKFDKSLILATSEIVEKCENYDIPKTGTMPVLNSDMLGGKSVNQYLEEIAWEGLKKRKLRSGIYVDRLRSELTTVYQLNYATYFIMVADIIKWARNKGILVGPGRGSSAGSLLAYALQITDLDPIKYELYFERFLNKDRISPPDIDVDIADNGRQEVLSYIRQKYGEERVAHIGSFSALGPRQSIRDVAIAHGMEYGKVNEILKEISHDPMLTFDDVKHMSCMQQFSNDVVKEAEAMAGKYRHMSTHAAGIIINNTDLHDDIPLTVKDGFVQTHYNMDELSKLGYTKFDILGLKTLGIIDKTIKNARIPASKLKAMYEYDDMRVYDLICSGLTIGVFQLEGWGYTKMVKRYRPQNFEDIMMINALYRPGPMQGGEGLEIILRRRNGEEQVTYKHPDLEPILRNTYGLPVFQEQVMRMCQILAGFSLSEADSMRSAIGKKDEIKLASFRSRFLQGCSARRLDINLAQEIFEDITFFNRYGWNRAHAAAYGAVTYYTAWLKTHYKEHFMAELLNAEDDAERLARIRGECHKMNIEFESVDINKSDIYFTVLYPYNTLLPGFANVKGIGEKAARAILDNRWLEGKFHSQDNARMRIARKVLNKIAFESLSKAGAFRDLPKIEIKEEVPF